MNDYQTSGQDQAFLPPYRPSEVTFQFSNPTNPYQPPQANYNNYISERQLQPLQQSLSRQRTVRLSEYESQRRQTTYKRSIDMAIQEMTFDFIALLTLTIFLIVDRRDECNYSIKTWLLVVDVYYGVDLLLLVCQLKHLNRYRKENLGLTLTKLACSFFLIGWLIYGNFFYYKDDNVCVEQAYGLNLIMFIVIIFGYYEMMKCCCLSTCVCCMLPLLFFAARGSSQPQWMPAAPNFIQNLAKTKFSRTNNTAMDQCAICLLDFQETDEITPLPCDPRHYFHPQCIESWLKNNNNCPLCKEPITQEALERQKKEQVIQQYTQQR